MSYLNTAMDWDSLSQVVQLHQKLRPPCSVGILTPEDRLELLEFSDKKIYRKITSSKKFGIEYTAETVVLNTGYDYFPDYSDFIGKFQWFREEHCDFSDVKILVAQHQLTCKPLAGLLRAEIVVFWSSAIPRTKFELKDM